MSTNKMIARLLWRYKNNEDVYCVVVGRPNAKAPLTVVLSTDKASVVFGESIGLTVTLSKDYLPKDRLEEASIRYSWRDFEELGDTARARAVARALIWGEI